jgi:hypothetical protein
MSPLLFEKYAILSKLALKLCDTFTATWLLVVDNDLSAAIKGDKW